MMDHDIFFDCSSYLLFIEFQITSRSFIDQCIQKYLLRTSYHEIWQK